MKIDFEYQTEYGLFSDALWFPDDQPLPSPEEIEAMKLERLNNWLAILANPPALSEPGPSEVQPV